MFEKIFHIVFSNQVSCHAFFFFSAIDCILIQSDSNHQTLQSSDERKDEEEKIKKEKPKANKFLIDLNSLS